MAWSLTVSAEDWPSDLTVSIESCAVEPTCWAASVAESLRSRATSWPTDFASSTRG